MGGVHRTCPFGNTDERSLDCSYLWRTKSPIPLRGKEDSNSFAPDSTSLQLDKESAWTGGGAGGVSFKHQVVARVHALSPLGHGALISHSLPSTNAAWVWNPVLEGTVSEDTWYL